MPKKTYNEESREDRIFVNTTMYLLFYKKYSGGEGRGREVAVRSILLLFLLGEFSSQCRTDVGMINKLQNQKSAECS